jgi:hypothetical protein
VVFLAAAAPRWTLCFFHLRIRLSQLFGYDLVIGKDADLGSNSHSLLDDGFRIQVGIADEGRAAARA